jgi:hypothetical protein
VRESESCHKGHVDNESQGVTSKAPPVAAGVARAGEAGAAMGGQSVWTVPETATQGGYRRDDGDPSQKVRPYSMHVFYLMQRALKCVACWPYYCNPC